ncbi:MAG: major capsid protein [Panacagrimonas sp.]
MKTYLKTHGLQLMLVALVIVATVAGVLPDAIANGGLSPEHGLGMVALAGVIARSPTVAPFPTDPVQTGIAIAYRNERLIADEVMPMVPVSAQEFRYRKWALKDAFTLPDTKVGRRSATNTVEFGSTEEVGLTDDHGLQAGIPLNDIDNAPPGYSPVNQHTMLLTDLVMLGREKRTADKVFNAANFGAAYKTTLAAGTRWSQTASTPIKDIELAKDAMIMRPNIMVMGRQTWRVLSQHASILKAINRNDGDSGIASRQAVAALFEMDDLLVGENWLNIANPGQATNMVRVWGPHCALLHRNKLANTQGGTTYGFTARWGTWFAGNWFDKDQGLRGSQIVRVGESTQQVITAPDLGYLFVNAGDES